MLRRLRRKFVAITMALVGAVLVGVLGSTLYSSWRAQVALIDESLSRALTQDLDELPMLGVRDRPDGGRDANMLVLSVDTGIDGTVIETSRAPLYINPVRLRSVVRTAAEAVEEAGIDFLDLEAGGDGRAPASVSGADAGYHVTWKATMRDPSTIRVVIADTTAMEAALSSQLASDAAIAVVSLAVLFALVWWLSGWALSPVAAAWEDQRRFVADASHELKTPLAVIIANTDILAREPGLPEGARRWVRSTSDEAGHMKSLVNDLLELARADEGAAGGGALRRVDVDLSEVVESASLEFDAIAFERGCTLDATVADGIHVTGDREWLERVVRILVDNACKYAGVGTSVSVCLARTGGHHATLTVNNRGPVIDADDLPHVFDRFYRSDRARTRGDASGFGLGLAIAKGIVEAHGGRILCTSDETTGTTFAVTL